MASPQGDVPTAREAPLGPLLAALRGLAAWLRGTATPGMIIGGVAASLLGRPRATRDVDALILLRDEEWDAFLREGRQHGFGLRRADALAFARQARVLLVRHEASEIEVDIALAALPFEEEAIARAREVTVAGVSFPLVSPEDLIVMKAVAQRPRDLADIAGVVAAHADLDLERVRTLVGEFAHALDSPDIIEALDQLLKEPDMNAAETEEA